ncbi:MAG TPA: TolC family protein [Syntrophales bacterium]|nr:TolC family protein [Syntrophales bacterium]HOX94228.1 TolC family protein [Syntrophales bacterium]HPI55976.1 TolC family protein [Syntrophales bacterium]HPN24134.1 TolC family protein [Syntrophales bacterium]HQM28413.1 TolC family protein [Syntrophales bacterium]
MIHPKGVPWKPVLVLLSIVLSFAIALPGSALTLDEAISLCLKNLPAYQAVLKQVQSSDALYKASYGPYLPSVDVGGSQQWHDTSTSNYDVTTSDATASLTLFDGFRREANRNIAKYNLGTDQEELRKSRLQVDFDVKVSFYTAIATRDILEHRKKQLENAQTDFEVAEGRHRFGVAKLSDVLQASVRLEQAKFNLIQAEGNVIKALSELASLIGKRFDEPYEIEGTLEASKTAPPEQTLSDLVMQRPEIRQFEYAVKRAESTRTLSYSPFYPTISASAVYSRTGETDIRSSFQDRAALLTASWNIFELGKFYRAKSARIGVGISEDNLREIERQLLLDLRRNYENFLTAAKNVDVAETQLKQAQQNYDQAFGEYKVGKGDILSLVVAEGLLQTAREQSTTSKLNLILSRALLERNAGVESLEILKAPPSVQGVDTSR